MSKEKKPTKPSLNKNTLKTAKEITIIRSPSVSVEAQRSLPIHTDGEAAFSRYKASVEILEEKLHIIAG